MGIIYCEKDRTFTLQTKNTTYQMQVDRYGFLLHLYYGKKTDGCMDYLLTYYDRGFSGNPYDAGEDRTYSMDTLPQEFPCYGNGDFRSTAFAVENADGSMSCDLRYKSHKIFDGKYNLEGLPAVYASDEEAQTLEILMEDPVTGVKVVLLYGVLSAQDIITRSVSVKNESSGKIYLNKIESASLDFLYGDYELLTFYGRHAMERNVQRVPVVHGTQKIGSVRGTSSHQYNPDDDPCRKRNDRRQRKLLCNVLCIQWMFPGRSVERSVKPDKNDAGTSGRSFSLSVGNRRNVPGSGSDFILFLRRNESFVSESASLYQATYLQRQI